MYVNYQHLYVIEICLKINATADLPRRAAMLVNFAGQCEGSFTQFQSYCVRI